MPLILKDTRLNNVVAAGVLVGILLMTGMCDSLRNDHRSGTIVHPSGKAFAGSQSCRGCHPSLVESHQETSHFLTSQAASPSTVKGSFDSARNVFELDDGLRVVMEERSGTLFQVGFVDGLEINARPMDLVIGSGRKGQTFLYWNGNELFQLPVSYYAPLDEWCNSPGYPRDQILFNRNISARCLECHGTYLKSKKLNQGTEVFDKDHVMLGVDCERCHGPAADHVAFQQKHTGEKRPDHVINPGRLTRKQKLDNCALCHAGIRRNIKSPFSFTVGDNLEDYSLPDYNAGEEAALDVHGNQVGLLMASDCYRHSNMDCSSCHNVHVKETLDLKLFSTRCMNCHAPGSTAFCQQVETPGLSLTENCIDCHMPALPSSRVLLGVGDRSVATPDLVRTHRIGIYREEVENYLKRLKPG